MKIRKRFTFILLLIFLSNNVSAQSTVGLHLWGGQFSGFTNKTNTYQHAANAAYKDKSVTGLLLGLSLRANIQKGSYLHTGLLYSMRGESYKYKAYKLDGYDVMSLSGGDEASIEYFLDYRLNYIEIPVMYCIDLAHSLDDQIPVHFYLSAGLSAGVNVVAQIKRNSFSIRSPGSTFSGIDENIEKDKVSDINPIIVNAVTDLEAEFRRGKEMRMFFYGRFNRSLTNTFKKESADADTKIVTYGFGFGLRWNINR